MTCACVCVCVCVRAPHLHTPHWDHGCVFNEAEGVEESHASTGGCVLEVDVAEQVNKTHHTVVQELKHGAGLTFLSLTRTKIRPLQRKIKIYKSPGHKFVPYTGKLKKYIKDQNRNESPTKENENI